MFFDNKIRVHYLDIGEIMRVGLKSHSIETICAKKGVIQEKRGVTEHCLKWCQSLAYGQAGSKEESSQ